MARLLVTGGSGFLGSLLIDDLLAAGHAVTSIDLLPGVRRHPRLQGVVGDIRDRPGLDRILSGGGFAGVFHCAALLAHGAVPEAEMWSSNVEGTRSLAAATAAAGVPSLVAISSNCLWGRGFARPVREDDAPEPCEPYGASKWEGEKVLAAHAGDVAVTVIRSPTIIDEGRLGLLAILFEFIAEGRRVWTVGDGSHRYQFIYARDLIAAMLLAWEQRRAGTFGIGSDRVDTMRESFAHVIAETGSRSRIVGLPKGPAVLAMRAAHALRLSPLGPYHYRMIAADFTFDTGRIKAALGWRPTLSNSEMLLRAYRYYAANQAEIAGRRDVSAHRRAADMGVIRALKWIS
ncbi:NAD-dependent epimerase/dehydratase family protein [Methylobacterium hispanicum]|uniref:NAD-dependent epimerase/dehydratase family protein n=1 Tax=Methylobacterium hispanicum TaxID=270350 RepID=UPI002F319E9A